MREFENSRMEPVKIASGRWVAFGHVVENFGTKAVVMGWREDAQLLIVKEADRVTSERWGAAPRFCK